jgi:hypothetical protein
MWQARGHLQLANLCFMPCTPLLAGGILQLWQQADCSGGLPAAGWHQPQLEQDLRLRV